MFWLKSQASANSRNSQEKCLRTNISLENGLFVWKLQRKLFQMQTKLRELCYCPEIASKALLKANKAEGIVKW